MRGETLTPNPNECNSTLTSGTNNIYPYPDIDVNDRGHRLRITHTLRRPFFNPPWPERSKGRFNGKVRAANESYARKVNIITIITPRVSLIFVSLLHRMHCKKLWF